MSAEVISLFGTREETTVEGSAKCVQCGHQWQAIVPAGTFWFECPECGLHRGAFIYPIGGGTGDQEFRCNECDSEILTAVWKAGAAYPVILCVKCGTDHTMQLFEGDNG